MRVGNHRVIYHADDGRILVTIVRVVHRGEA
ncbi:MULTISPECIES: type II toxin-antitoxin system RelE family toxin [Frankia]